MGLLSKYLYFALIFNLVIVLHLPLYIKHFGSILGWWSMIFEHKQYKLKSSCRTSKNYLKHLVMQQEQKDHLQRFKRSNHVPSALVENQFLFYHQPNSVVVIAKGYPIADDLISECVFERFVDDTRQLFPDRYEEVLADSIKEECLLLSYKKVRVGNCIFSRSDHSKTKLRCNSYMEIKNKATPPTSRHFNPKKQSEFPQFAECHGIYSIKPFQSGVYKESVFYYFYVTKLETLGFHRSLWYVDLTEETLDESSCCLIAPNDIRELQVVFSQHGDLQDGFQSAMRFGRDPILYAPLAA